MSMKDLWYRFLAAMARGDGRAPGMNEEPKAPRDVAPHGKDKAVHEEPHTWKTHGGDRH